MAFTEQEYTKEEKWHYENAKSRSKQNVQSLAPGQKCQSHSTKQARSYLTAENTAKRPSYGFPSSEELKEGDHRTQHKEKFFYYKSIYHCI